MSGYVGSIKYDYQLEPNEPIKQSIFREYEKIIVESLITSFGLDLLIKDQHGGDVDTIHNVRQIGIDKNMDYKNQNNKDAYLNKEAYDKGKYHSHSNYKNTVKEAKDKFNRGQSIKDAYTGDNIYASKRVENGKQAQLDHVLAAKYVHEDRGRVLSGLNGTDLANDSSNLRFTNNALNNNMKDKSIPEYIAWCEKNPDKVNWNGVKGQPLPADVKEKLMSEYNRAKKDYDRKISVTYYTSSKFAKDLSFAAGKMGLSMGLRQALGLFLSEIWFAVKDEFNEDDGDFELSKFFHRIADGVKKGYSNALEKYETLFKKFGEGFISGTLSSLTTTICNIFFTTAKSTVKIIRQSYASIVQACEVLFINPDNYEFGDRMKATTKIIATGASVVLGGIVSEAISKTALGLIPVLGEVVTTFCGTLTTGIMSCTLLYFLDNNELFNKLVNYLNTHIITIDGILAQYTKMTEMFKRYAAELMNIDYELLRKETQFYNELAFNIENAKDEFALEGILVNAIKSLNISMQWNNFDEFDELMQDDDFVLEL